MNDNGRKRIDFKFSKNWKAFMEWHDAYYARAKCAPTWEDQTRKIEACFEPSNPQIVDWSSLWSDFATWFIKIKGEKELVLWAEQKRQIETLMLNQLDELNREQFVLAYLYYGAPRIDSSLMTYWDAERTKLSLEGDKNGNGGDERMDRIKIVNLKKIIFQ